MTKKACVVPSPDGEFVELGRTKLGKLFRKEILKTGTYAHPNKPGEMWTIDDAMLASVLTNFESNVCPIVQVPICGKDNEHTEDGRDNAGEVIGLERNAKGGIDAIIDARKHADDFGKTLLGASAMLAFDYTDTKTNLRVGPTLLHAAITNRPYITDLGGFEEYIAASADLDRDDVAVLRAPSPGPAAKPDAPRGEEEQMTKEEALALLKKEGIDVESLQVEAAKVADLEKQLEDAHGDTENEDSAPELVAAMTALQNAGVIKLTAGQSKSDISPDEIARAVVELANRDAARDGTIKALVADNETMKLSAATKEIDELISVGRVLPTQKDGMLELSMSNRPMFESLLPASPVVSLSEEGVTAHDSTVSKDTSDEIARLTAMANGRSQKES